MTYRPRPEQLNAILDQAEATIRSLRVDLPELLRRRQHEASDGYPSASISDGPGGGGISNPTLRTALAHKPDDPVARSIDLVLKSIGELGQLSQLIDNNRVYALSLGDTGRERESTVNVCEACSRVVLGGEKDPWRKRLCNTDYRAFMRWSERQADPDRHVWLRLRQAELANAS